MTNSQLWLAIGIPSVLVVLSWIQQNARFSAMERRFDSVDRRFETVDNKFDSIRTEMISLRDTIHRDMITLHERVAVVEAKHS